MREKTLAVAVALETDDGYPAFEAMVSRRVHDLEPFLFQTSAEGLWDLYLAGLPADRQQHYRCHSCRRFIERYGGLVVIDEAGSAISAIWDHVEVPEFFAESISRMKAAVERAKVTGVFLSSDKVWGTPVTKDWAHLAGEARNIFVPKTLTAEQFMAEKLQDFIILQQGLADYSLAAVEQAVRVLEADAFDRSEKTLGVAKWLLALHVAIKDVKGPRRSNLIWLAVATAPPGFCHVRSKMISTLLDDIVAGLPFEAIKRKWAEKMHPLQYQRPSAAPSSGAIAQAEKVIAGLQSAGSLARRFARLDDIQNPLWLPRGIEVKEVKPGGIFGHLKRENGKVKAVELPAKTLTWEKFRETVLPTANAMEVRVPGGRAPFCAMVTASNPDAPPILQWDGLEGHPRNPVSWYVYNMGSMAHTWNLTGGAYVKVNAIASCPSSWQEPAKFKHQGEQALFVLEGCRDTNTGQGLGLFPETLKAEYHGIRSVIEAYSRIAKIEGEGSACGLALSKNEAANLTVRVNGDQVFTIDRWE